MAASTEDGFPRPYCRSRRGRNGFGSETSTAYNDNDNDNDNRNISFNVDIIQFSEVIHVAMVNHVIHTL